MNWHHLAAGRMRLPSTPSLSLAPGGVPTDAIAFSGGNPAAELFPIDALATAFEAAARQHGRRALQYGPTEGIAPLREAIASHMASRNVRVDPEQLLVTSGSLQAIDLVARVLLEPGDVVVVDAPTFTGTLNCLRMHDVRFVSVATDDYGTRVEELAEQLRAGLRPKLLYALPTFHNPVGVTMTSARRTRLLELAAQYEMAVLEDDPYGDLWFHEAPPTPLVGQPGGEHVFFAGTFSKILAPGLRLGWIVRPRGTEAMIATAKRSTDLHTDQLLQYAVHRWMSDGDFAAHVEALRRVYRQRAEAMLEALDRHMPDGVHWTRPQGGFFIWVTLPEGADGPVVVREAANAGVLVVSGTGFYASGGGQNTIRLAYSQADIGRIGEGIRRLARVVADHLGARSLTAERVRVPREGPSV